MEGGKKKEVIGKKRIRDFQNQEKCEGNASSGEEGG